MFYVETLSSPACRELDHICLVVVLFCVVQPPGYVILFVFGFSIRFRVCSSRSRIQLLQRESQIENQTEKLNQIDVGVAT